MDINQMTRSQFKELPLLKEFKGVKVDSIVLLPTRLRHDSGYNYYQVVACNENEAIGRASLYDTFSIDAIGKNERIGIDCLRGSGLMRIFFMAESYILIPAIHSIRKKEGN